MSDIPDSKKRKRGGSQDAGLALQDSATVTKSETKKQRKARKESARATDHGDHTIERNEQQDKKDFRAAKTHQEHASHSESHASGISPAAPRHCVYEEAKALTDLPQNTVDEYLREKLVTIEDTLATKHRPILDLKHLPQSQVAASFRNSLGYTKPTPIQAAAWPYLFAGRDVVGVAETGSGKTMAFTVPCLHAIASAKVLAPPNKTKARVVALVVAPTRELAMQSDEQMRKLAEPLGMHVACIYGGVPKDAQRQQLKFADIVVATPGRLNDLIDEGCARMKHLKYIVLDEADRMLDKGFEEDIRKILRSAPSTDCRQMVMFTATWPDSIRGLAATFMSSPVKVNIGDNPDGDLRANTRIEQRVEVLDPRAKEQRLLQLLKQHQKSNSMEHRILVFCLYKKEAVRVESTIKSRGFRVASIHGDLSQEQRTRSLAAFKQGQCSVLVATDVAARGLDIPDVPLVINCTFPLTVEDYVHRIGRTGRAGKTGLAITLFTEHDKAQSGSLINVLKAANQPVPDELLKFGTTVKKKEHGSYGAFYKSIDASQTAKKIKF